MYKPGPEGSSPWAWAPACSGRGNTPLCLMPSCPTAALWPASDASREASTTPHIYMSRMHGGRGSATPFRFPCL